MKKVVQRNLSWIEKIPTPQTPNPLLEIFAYSDCTQDFRKNNIIGPFFDLEGRPSLTKKRQRSQTIGLIGVRPSNYGGVQMLEGHLDGLSDTQDGSEFCCLARTRLRYLISPLNLALIGLLDLMVWSHIEYTSLSSDRIVELVNGRLVLRSFEEQEHTKIILDNNPIMAKALFNAQGFDADGMPVSRTHTHIFSTRPHIRFAQHLESGFLSAHERLRTQEIIEDALTGALNEFS